MLAMLAALNPPEYLQDLIIFASSGLAGCFLMPMLICLYWPSMTAKGAIAGLLGGLASHLSLYIIGYVVNGKFESYSLLKMDPFIWAVITSGILSIAFSLGQNSYSKKSN